MREGLLIAGKYMILRPLGAGGMGTVWLGRNELTEREFAIKVLHPAAAANPRILMRFFQEAKVSGRLRHPSILEIFDVGTAPELGGAPFLVMELLEGASIDILLGQRGPLPLRVTLQVLIAICHALSLAHEKGIIHRDLKPGNIFLHRNVAGGVVPKLLDFGISKIAASGTPDATVGLTQTGAVLGSPLYMSPEQAAGDRDLDARSDIHALGVVLWECLTAKTPFKAETYNNLVVEIMTGDRPRLSATLSDVSNELSEIASRCFARRPEDRFATALDLAAALEGELAKLGPGPSLDSKALGTELLASAISKRTEHAPAAGTPVPHTSTTGAVSVSPARQTEAAAQGRSPAAYTVASGPTHTLPYAQTEIAEEDARQRTTGGERVGSANERTPSSIALNDSDSAGGGARAMTATPSQMPTLPRPSRTRGWLVAGGGVAVVAIVAVVAVVARNGAPRDGEIAPIASSASSASTTHASATSVVPIAATTSTTATAPATTAEAPSVLDAGAPAAPTTTAPVASTAPPATTSRTSPRVTSPTPPRPTSRPATQAAPTPPPDPHHGITNSGL